MYSSRMKCRKITAGGKKLTAALVIGILSFSTPSYADIFMGFNTDGTPIYGPEPQGATGPIATPENPTWIKNPDGSPTQAELDYTFIPNAEERAKLPPPPPPPPGMITQGFNTDGTPIYGPEPQGATGPIATPENPAWIKNPDGSPTQAELDYTFIPNAEERAQTANAEQIQSIVENEITTSKFTKVKKGSTYTLTSNVEISAVSPTIRVIAVKKGSANKKVSFTYSEDGQLVLKASQKLKGYQLQIISDEKILKKITL
ncbi:hypothetical protein MCETARE7_00278 [Candidatus Nanopelagicaceae bacterium]